MRKFITALLTAFTLTAYADNRGTITASNTEGFGSSENLIYNSNFEAGTSILGSGWTESGGTFSIWVNTPLRGAREGLWDSSAAGQTLSSKLSAISVGMYGQNAEASCLIRTASGTATHTLSVSDGTNTIASGRIVSSPTAVYTRVQFVMPTSGSVRLVLTSVAADEPSIEIDDCYVGLNTGIAQVSQATMYAAATLANGTTCNFQENTSSSLSNFVDLANTATACGSWSSTGNISVTANDYRATISNMPPGEYEIVLTGRFSLNAAGSGAFRISDGTNTSPPQTFAQTGSASGSTPVLVFRMRFESAASRTFKIQCSDNIASACVLDNSTGVGSEFSWTFKRFPLSSETVVRADVLSGLWGSRYFPDGSGSWSTTSTSYVSVTAANLFTSTTNKGSAVACTDANAICLKVPQLLPGAYKIDYTGAVGVNGAGTACSFAIGDGSADYEISGTYAAGGTYHGISGSTVITYNSVQTNKEFTVKAKYNIGPAACAIQSSPNIGHNLTITPLSQNLPVPVYVGSVSSGSSGQERIERISANSSGVLQKQSSNWVGNASVSGARYTYTIASGVFSDGPTCICAATLTSSGAGCQIWGSPTATQAIVNTYGAGGSASPFAHELICMGPRP